MGGAISHPEFSLFFINKPHSCKISHSLVGLLHISWIFLCVFHLEILPSPFWDAGREFPIADQSQEGILSSFFQQIPMKPKNCEKNPNFAFFHFLQLPPAALQPTVQPISMNFCLSPANPKITRWGIFLQSRFCQAGATTDHQIQWTASRMAQHCLESMQQAMAPPQHLD